MFQGSKSNQKYQDPDPEVVPRAKRRYFSEAYKKRILEEYASCTEPGEKGALLRSEGIYSSYITAWKRQLERGKLAGSEDKKRGPKEDPNQEELEKLKEENERLRERLRQSKLIIKAQKNLIDAWTGGERERREQMIREAKELACKIGVTKACKTMGIPKNPENFLLGKIIRESFLTKKKQQSGKSSTAYVSRTKHPGMFMPPYWMKEPISAAGEKCIESWKRMTKYGKEEPIETSKLQKAVIIGHQAQANMVLGHHQTPGTG